MAKPASGLAALQGRLGHQFRSLAQLQLALTHRSHGAPNNERLEFLGDALLGAIVAAELFRRFPLLREGELSRLRARLVSGPGIAALARELELGAHLRLSANERQGGGADRDAALADALEAVVAAIYLDAGIDAASAAVGRWYAGRLDTLDPQASHKDAKTELQEWLQARRAALPQYDVVRVVTSGDSQRFDVVCRAAGLAGPVAGSGRSRRIAEQQAARAALAELRNRNTDDD